MEIAYYAKLTRNRPKGPLHAEVKVWAKSEKLALAKVLRTSEWSAHVWPSGEVVSFADSSKYDLVQQQKMGVTLKRWPATVHEFRPWSKKDAHLKTMPSGPAGFEIVVE